MDQETLRFALALTPFALLGGASLYASARMRQRRRDAAQRLSQLERRVRDELAYLERHSGLAHGPRYRGLHRILARIEHRKDYPAWAAPSTTTAIERGCARYGIRTERDAA